MTANFVQPGIKNPGTGSGSEFTDAFALGVASSPINWIEGSEHPLAVVPDGFKIVDLQQFMPSPERIDTSVTLFDVDSFCTYVNTFKGTPLLFADKAKSAVIAILDYHEKEKASWCSHKATLQLKLSPEWLRWNQLSGKAMSQTAFAEFLEDNFQFITDPDGATILEAATFFEAKKNVSFKSGVNLSNGAVELTYIEDTQGNTKGKTTIPKELKLLLPVFDLGEPVTLTARLRYNINDGNLKFTFLLNQADQVLEKAFGDVLTNITTETGCNPLRGTA